MLIKRPTDILSSDITSESVYLERRKLLQAAAASMLAAGMAAPFAAANAAIPKSAFKDLKSSPFSTGEEKTPHDMVTGYNNFYEFSTDKTGPAKLSKNFRSDPWSVSIEGEAEVTGTFSLEDLIKPHTLEERIYRLRCVEAWSMVVPWVGIPLGDILKRFKPLSSAKYVYFETLNDPEQFPGQKRQVLDWPYREGLRMDEAMNPLTILATGLYNDPLLAQNGAPLRLVVPWKYGFKSIKSIVKIKFVKEMPETSWNMSGPKEYGFYANVNPKVAHPRWSQKREVRLPSLFGSKNTKTQLFNGYADQVASMYSGMNLRKYF
ncbi:protein-methionine-sulfoxide reductase catalytic subunit MsrP [Pelagibaculum spongiae]|uniref:Protein-methionine-sulfoxide reductase catalytic subunit MsrP n=1 Tax=Pelagibaculum spongiae TaxID=2080658 RepID=A0A2V1H0W8_9GAMM|nr:protein-methionine-sulfoxide reductase catalytic subunit MsrP [Pelagibaculum spongiae]PVZ72123.1 protein-methionine-sulfoxide reductase catalytic subunit MsrP [Pelagibaculum spongiae]